MRPYPLLAALLLSLVSGCSGEAVDPAIDGALLEAVVTGKASTVVELLARGANPNARDDHGQSALAHAVERRQDSMVRTLLKYGAEPNPSEGDTPLCLAVKNGSPGITGMLLESGADLEVGCRVLAARALDAVALALEVVERSPFLIALTECDEEGMAHILKRVGATHLRDTDAMEVLRATSDYGIDENCAKVARMVFEEPNQDLGLCDEPIRFVGVEGRAEMIKEGLIDLDLDGDRESIVGGNCGSCGCSWTFYRLLDGSWEEMDNIECGGGWPYDLRGSSKLVNGYRVLCLKATPRFYWSTTKPFGPGVRDGYVAYAE